MSDIHAYGKGLLPDLLSPEYAFYGAAARMPGGTYQNGVTYDAMADALRSDGQPLEAHYPYLKDLPADSALPAPQLKSGTKKHQTDSTVAIATVPEITALLKKGILSVLILRLTASFHRATSINPIVSYKAGEVERGLHAIVAVGYGSTDSGETHIKVRNSWGHGWGDSGHAWIHEAYIQNHLDSHITLL